MQNTHDDDFEFGDVIPRATYYAMALTVLLTFAYLPLGRILGLCNYFGGAVSADATPYLTTMIHFGFYLVVIHCALIWPMTHQVSPHLATKPPWFRTTFTTLFIAAPLMSYAYYRGGASDVYDIHEIIVSILPAVVVAVLFFESTGRRWILTALIATMTFVPLFVANHVMGKIPVLLVYGPRSGAFWIVRTALPLLSLVFAIVFVKKLGTRSQSYLPA